MVVAMETVEIINTDLERGRLEDLTGPSEARNLKLQSQQTEREVHLPGQVEENFSVEHRFSRLPKRPTKNSLPKNEQTMQPSNSTSDNNDYAKSEQKKTFQKCLNYFRFLARILGIRIAHDWKPLKYFLYIFNCFFHFLTGFSILYTVYVHFAEKEYIRMLEPLSVSGLLVSCDLKMYGFVKHGHQLLAIVFSTRKYFRSNIFGRQADVIKERLQKTWTFIVVINIGILFSVTFYAVTPVMVYIATKQITPLMPIEIIFCDLEETSGFVYTTIAHLIMGSYSAVVSMLYGTAFIFSIGIYILQVHLLAEDFKELDELWEGKHDTTVQYRHEFLKNICKKRQDMNNYLEAIKYIYETKLFIYFCFNYFSQILCLYNITKNDWIGGYGPACGLFLEMMFFCFLGTQVSIVDDKLQQINYNCNWYKYDIKSQRIFCMMLHEAQRAKELQLGPIGALNLVTGISIVKSIYSYYTVLTELF